MVFHDQALSIQANYFTSFTVAQQAVAVPAHSAKLLAGWKVRKHTDKHKEPTFEVLEESILIRANAQQGAKRAS